MVQLERNFGDQEQPIYRLSFDCPDGVGFLEGGLGALKMQMMLRICLATALLGTLSAAMAQYQTHSNSFDFAARQLDIERQNGLEAFNRINQSRSLDRAESIVPPEGAQAEENETIVDILNDAVWQLDSQFRRQNIEFSRRLEAMRNAERYRSLSKQLEQANRKRSFNCTRFGSNINCLEN